MREEISEPDLQAITSLDVHRPGTIMVGSSNVIPNRRVLGRVMKDGGQFMWRVLFAKTLDIADASKSLADSRSNHRHIAAVWYIGGIGYHKWLRLKLYP